MPVRSATVAASSPKIARPRVERQSTVAIAPSMTMSAMGSARAASSVTMPRCDAAIAGPTSGSQAMKSTDVAISRQSSARRSLLPSVEGAPGSVSIPASARADPASMSEPDSGFRPEPLCDSDSEPSHDPTPASHAVALQPSRSRLRRSSDERAARKNPAAATAVLVSMATSLTGRSVAWATAATPAPIATAASSHRVDLRGMARR